MSRLFNFSLWAVTILIGGLLLEGCLVGHKIVYQIDVNSHGRGVATVTYTDIRSNAANETDLDKDKNTLFSYMIKSNQFVSDMKKEGKEIISRKLYLENGKLNGKASYRFEKISDVENLSYEDNFYYVTLQPDDSVITTNGVILRSSSFKRILWDSTFTSLQFEILTEPAEDAKLTDMAQFYDANE